MTERFFDVLNAWRSADEHQVPSPSHVAFPWSNDGDVRRCFVIERVTRAARPRSNTRTVPMSFSA